MSIFVTVDGRVDVAHAVSAAVHAVDAGLPVSNVQMLSDRLTRSVAPRRFVTVLLGGFALVALALAMLGIWG